MLFAYLKRKICINIITKRFLWVRSSPHTIYKSLQVKIYALLRINTNRTSRNTMCQFFSLRKVSRIPRIWRILRWNQMCRQDLKILNFENLCANINFCFLIDDMQQKPQLSIFLDMKFSSVLSPHDFFTVAKRAPISYSSSSAGSCFELSPPTKDHNESKMNKLIKETWIVGL